MSTEKRGRKANIVRLDEREREGEVGLKLAEVKKAKNFPCLTDIEVEDERMMTTRDN